MTCAVSASLSSVSAPDFAIAAYFNADLSMRSTPSFVASLARIASFKSKSNCSCNVMQANYGDEIQLSICGRRLMGDAEYENYIYEAASRFAERSGYRAASRSAQLRTESASLTDTTSTSLQVRRNKPASTPPGPSSIKNSQPRPLSRSMQSSQRTVPVT